MGGLRDGARGAGGCGDAGTQHGGRAQRGRGGSGGPGTGQGGEDLEDGVSPQPPVPPPVSGTGGVGGGSCRKMGAGGVWPCGPPSAASLGVELGSWWAPCRGTVVTRNPSETRFSAVFPFFFLSSFWLDIFFIVQKV